MSIPVHCPEGHLVRIDAAKLGNVVFCPQCYTSFDAELTNPLIRQAKSDGPKPKRPRDEDDKPVKKKVSKKDDDDDEEDEKPQKKKIRKKDEDEEPEKPRKKPAKVRRDEDDDEDEDDEDDEDEEDAPKDEDDEPIEWNKRKRQLAVVKTGMTSYLIGVNIMLAMMSILSLLQIALVIFLGLAFFDIGGGMALLIIFAELVIAGIGFPPIYICHLVGWITGLFSPPKSGGRAICIAALVMLICPVFFYLAYLIFANFIIQRIEVIANLLFMYYAFASVLLLMAFYCSLIYMGRMAAFMGLNTDKHKPPALGWFIVGGTIFLGLCVGLGLYLIYEMAKAVAKDPTGFPTMLFLALFAVAGFMLAVFYFIISSLRELVGVVQNIRKAIDEYIKYS